MVEILGRCLWFGALLGCLAGLRLDGVHTSKWRFASVDMLVTRMGNLNLPCLDCNLPTLSYPIGDVLTSAVNSNSATAREFSAKNLQHGTDHASARARRQPPLVLDRAEKRQTKSIESRWL